MLNRVLSRRVPLRGGLCGAFFVVAAAAGACTSQPGADRSREPGEWAGTQLPEPVERPDFVLTTTEGTPYDFLAETEGSVALLFFGFTHCPDICPVHMSNLAVVMRELPREVQQAVRIVFITVDPDRDTPERLDEWLGAMTWPIVGLRGTIEEVNAIERSLGLPPSTVTQREDGTIDVGHSAAVLAFGADGPARFTYPWGTRQRDWIADVPRLVHETVGADRPAAQR